MACLDSNGITSPGPEAPGEVIWLGTRGSSGYYWARSSCAGLQKGATQGGQPIPWQENRAPFRGHSPRISATDSGYFLGTVFVSAAPMPTGMRTEFLRKTGRQSPLAEGTRSASRAIAPFGSVPPALLYWDLLVQTSHTVGGLWAVASLDTLIVGWLTLLE